MEGDQLAPEVRPASLSHLVSGPAVGPTVGAQSLRLQTAVARASGLAPEASRGGAGSSAPPTSCPAPLQAPPPPRSAPPALQGRMGCGRRT